MPNYSPGQIITVDLEPALGRELKKERPCLVVSPTITSIHLGVITVIPIRGKNRKPIKSFEVQINNGGSTGLAKVSKICVPQIKTVDKSRVTNELGICGDKILAETREVMAKFFLIPYKAPEKEVDEGIEEK